MTSIADQVPLLAERRQAVRALFQQRGIDRFDTQADQDACVEALADERLRAAFEAAFKLFTMSMEIVLPRPEALPFVPDAKAFGAIAFAARRRYREEGFDASLYGGRSGGSSTTMLRTGIEQKIPPISITEPTSTPRSLPALGPGQGVGDGTRDPLPPARALGRGPEHYGRLSERLEESSKNSASSGSSSRGLGDLLPRSGPAARPTTAA
jgi:type I restriction enzyme R subunit